MKRIYKKPITESIRLRLYENVLVESKKYKGWTAEISGLSTNDKNLMA